MRVVITGVAGLLGSRMAEWIILNKPDVRVVGIDDLSGGFRDNVPSGVEFIQEDLAEAELGSIFKGGVDYLFHFAAYAAEGLSPFIRRYNYRNNVIATANLINASIEHGVGRFVFTSSMATYGDGAPPFDERDELKPIDPYGIAKLACEMDLRVANEQHGLQYCIIKPHNVYGRGQNIWDRYRNVLGIWMYNILHGKPITIYGDGKQTRAFSYIDDSLEPLWNSAENPKAAGEIINLGGIEEIEICEAARVLSDITGGVEINYLEARHEVKHAWSTWEKSVDILGFQYKTSLEEGVRQMWEWAKAQPERQRSGWDKYELDRGLYSYWKETRN